MAERPADLPPLDSARLSEAENLLRHESSISFQSERAHKTAWMLVEFAKAHIGESSEGMKVTVAVLNLVEQALRDADIDPEVFSRVRRWVLDGHPYGPDAKLTIDLSGHVSVERPA